MEFIFHNDNNVKIILPEHRLSSHLCNRSDHEVLFRRIHTFLFKNIIDINKNIIDLGAFIGDNSIPWSKNINGLVYAIDPSNENISFINEVKKINNLDNLITIEKPISDSKRIVSTNDNLHHCMFTLNNYGANVIESTSLDILYEEKIIENIDYIHLDVEGMEKLVIYGSEKIIEKYKPTISFEQHIESEDYIGLSNHLKTNGYIVYLINESFQGCRVDCRNLLAIHETKITNDFQNELENHLNVTNLLIKL